MPVAGERSAHRRVEIPENFDTWPQDGRVQFVRNAMSKEDVLRAIVESVGCDDEEVSQALSKDQAAEVYLHLRTMEESE